MIPRNEIVGVHTIFFNGIYRRVNVPPHELGLDNPAFRITIFNNIDLTTDIEDFFQQIIDAAAPLENPKLSWDIEQDGDDAYTILSVVGQLKPNEEQLQVIHESIDRQIAQNAANADATVRRTLQHHIDNFPETVFDMIRISQLGVGIYTKEQLKEKFDNIVEDMFQ